VASLDIPRSTQARKWPGVLLSLGLHGAALGLLLVSAARARLNVVEPQKLCCVAVLEVAGGSRAPRLPLPEQPAAQPILKPARPPRQTPQPKASGTDAAAAHLADRGSNIVAGNGSDAEDRTPAFPIFSPHPPVHDRSLLPVTEQRVVVDVKLSAGGDVVSETLVKGMGNALDRSVLDIVKTWRFQPATVNGKPVPSEAEVIVPFSKNYPIFDMQGS
jgi:TonB family protein